MKHRHLELADDAPIEQQPLAAIVDVLERGDLDDWREIARAVARDPAGSFARDLLRLVDAYPMYGTSPLWRAWIDRQRAAPARPPPVGLAELRRAHGLTQVEVARRMGISQSDLSKLERRTDVRLSTLRAFVCALGGDLLMAASFNGREYPVRVPGRED